MSRYSDYGRVERRATGEQPTVHEIVSMTRNAAEQLVTDLDQAQQLTNNWTDDPLTSRLVHQALRRCLGTLAATQCWGESNLMPSADLWRIAGGYLEQGLLQLRSRLKPRGHAGDYELLTRIIQRTSSSHSLGAALDACFLGQAVPLALGNKIDLITEELLNRCLNTNKKSTHIISFGCGPAIELEQLVSVVPEACQKRLRVTLLDSDPGALASARNRLQKVLSNKQVETHCENLFRLPEPSGPTLPISPADVVISSEMLNYLSDTQAAEMLAFLGGHLSRGGEMLVSSFAAHLPSRAYLEWIGNWYLNYRDASALTRVAALAGYGEDQVGVSWEPLGIGLFLKVRRP